MVNKIRIFIADDHALIRQGVQMIVSASPRFEVVGEAGDGLSAAAGIIALQPDVALLDVDMPGQDGFAIAKDIKANGLATKIVFLTMHKNVALLQAALNLGASGYLLKDSVLADIIGCLEAVVVGRPYFSAELAGLMAQQIRGSQPAASPLSLLSPTERRVLQHISAYKTSREIADTLCISIRTVDRHRANISIKLDLSGSHALVKFALQHQAEL